MRCAHHNHHGMYTHPGSQHHVIRLVQEHSRWPDISYHREWLDHRCLCPGQAYILSNGPSKPHRRFFVSPVLLCRCITLNERQPRLTARFSFPSGYILGRLYANVLLAALNGRKQTQRDQRLSVKSARKSTSNHLHLNTLQSQTDPTATRRTSSKTYPVLSVSVTTAVHVDDGPTTSKEKVSRTRSQRSAPNITRKLTDSPPLSPFLDRLSGLGAPMMYERTYTTRVPRSSRFPVQITSKKCV